ncbi:hypothetical protein B9Z55_004211 [Caenorhabditis nigoni]|uniref:Uncharacterized protein n=1 Tax=Caenorhabditis nigoni TaxID=1611254 RepID=A0A2G5UVV5_9PELO|nr:hypothetical protein B9Z55_004211 [Caenorhabditis nigoni]
MRMNSKVAKSKKRAKSGILKFEKEKIPRKTLKYLEDRVAEVVEDPTDIQIGPCYDSDRDECIFTNKNSNQSEENIDEFLELLPHLDVDRAILFLSEFQFPEAVRVAQKLCASTLLPHQLAKRKLRMKEISKVKNSSAKRSSFITRSSRAGKLQETSNDGASNENRKRKINQISSPEEPETPKEESISTEKSPCQKISESQEIEVILTQFLRSFPTFWHKTSYLAFLRAELQQFKVWEEPKTKKKCGRPRKNTVPENGEMEIQKARFPKREIKKRTKSENLTGNAEETVKIGPQKKEMEPKKDRKIAEKLSKFRRKSSIGELAENAQADLAKLLEF